MRRRDDFPSYYYGGGGGPGVGFDLGGLIIFAVVFVPVLLFLGIGLLQVLAGGF